MAFIEEITADEFVHLDNSDNSDKRDEAGGNEVLHGNRGYMKQVAQWPKEGEQLQSDSNDEPDIERPVHGAESREGRLVIATGGKGACPLHDDQCIKGDSSSVGMVVEITEDNIAT